MSSWRAKEPKAALSHFDAALERPAARYVSALVGHGQTLLALIARPTRSRRSRRRWPSILARRPRAARRGLRFQAPSRTRRRAAGGAGRPERRGRPAYTHAITARPRARSSIVSSAAVDGSGRERRRARAFPPGRDARPGRRRVARADRRNPRGARRLRAPSRPTTRRWRIEPNAEWPSGAPRCARAIELARLPAEYRAIARRRRSRAAISRR